MFLEKEIAKYVEHGGPRNGPGAHEPGAHEPDAALTPSTPSTPSTQSTPPLDLGPLRFVDLLKTWDLGPGAPLYLLLSDGERHVVAVAARSVYEPFRQQIDPEYSVQRMLLIRHMGLVPWKREHIPLKLAHFIREVNTCKAVLKVSVMQLRGGAWLSKTTGPPPPEADDLGPLPSRPQSSPFRLPLSFEAERPPQFAPVEYSDDEGAASLPDNQAGLENGTLNGFTPEPMDMDQMGEDSGSPAGERQDHAGGMASALTASQVQRLKEESDANFAQLVALATGASLESPSPSREPGVEPPEEPRPDGASADVAAPPEVALPDAELPAVSQSLPPGNTTSETHAHPTTNEGVTWTEAETSALIFGIVYARGQDWDKVLELYGPEGTIGDDLRAKSLQQIRQKASALKHEQIRLGQRLPPGFEAVPLYADESSLEPKRLRLDVATDSPPLTSAKAKRSLHLSTDDEFSAGPELSSLDEWELDTEGSRRSSSSKKPRSHSSHHRTSSAASSAASSVGSNSSLSSSPKSSQAPARLSRRKLRPVSSASSTASSTASSASSPVSSASSFDSSFSLSPSSSFVPFSASSTKATRDSLRRGARTRDESSLSQSSRAANSVTKSSPGTPPQVSGTPKEFLSSRSSRSSHAPSAASDSRSTLEYPRRKARTTEESSWSRLSPTASNGSFVRATPENSPRKARAPEESSPSRVVSQSPVGLSGGDENALSRILSSSSPGKLSEGAANGSETTRENLSDTNSPDGRAPADGSSQLAASGSLAASQNSGKADNSRTCNVM